MIVGTTYIFRPNICRTLKFALECKHNSNTVFFNAEMGIFETI